MHARAVAVYAEWDKHADHMAGLLLELEGLQGAIKAHNRTISAAGLEPVVLPSVAQSVSEVRETETVRVEVPHRGPVVQNAQGQEIGAGGGLSHGGRASRSAPTYRVETREHITRPGKRVADLLDRAVVIPRAVADHRAGAWIERRG